jgi:hypothetical protein
MADFDLLISALSLMVAHFYAGTQSVVESRPNGSGDELNRPKNPVT